MKYHDSLNHLMDTIEKELENEIDYHKLAKVIGTSSYTMQRIFVFLTGETLTEYIRKRRLSKAAEELRKTECKIIDIAMKYYYSSPVSFSNAFKKMYGQSPATFRKNSTHITFFPKIKFENTINGVSSLNYHIVEREEQVFYGKTTGIIAYNDKKAIQDLYKQCAEDGTMEIFSKSINKKELYYGIYYDIYENGKYQYKGEYFLLGKVPHKDFVEVKLPKLKWACFRLPNHEQDEILKCGNNIYERWLPSSAYYKISKYPELEIYYEDYCEVCIAIQ